ncbi:serine/threonine-protein kinase [Microbacterium deminutum]|uniref:non-specific serine/threonine protein kinase n=1 Tax=Microbacterium deminutum TaxID=344164 RepID=A0ABN2RAB9_9MICO
MSQLGEVGEISTGELLDGRYRLEQRIGEGGAARVYRAEDTLLGRTVAIKVLRAQLDGLATPERAQSETALLASLNHHGLVTLFDARVSHDEGSYLVMEYVEGITLRDRIARGPIDPAAAASLAVDIAEGLHVAHLAGIVHRDIKPSNILLWESPVPGQGWRAKIADFGIAYLLDSARVTTPGLMVGTVAYIAPEQARGSAPAPPADIYSLGIVLIEALTGVRPFADAQGIGAVVARLQGPPPISDSLDERWRQLLCGMTAMQPDDRPTAIEVAMAASQLAAVDDARAPQPASLPEVTAVQPRHDGTERTAVLPPLPAVATADVLVGTTGDEAVAPSRVGDGPPDPRRRRRAWLAAIVLGALLVAAVVGAGIWSASTSAGTTPQPVPSQSLPEQVVEPSVAPTPGVAPTPSVAPAGGSTTPAGDGVAPSNAGNNPNSGPGDNNGGGNGNGNGKDKDKGKGKSGKG